MTVQLPRTADPPCPSLATDALRLAWYYARQGRRPQRDLFLTLAVAHSRAGEAVWAERCRRWLGKGRPGHPFARHPTVGAALADPRFADEVAKLRRRIPPERLRWLVDQAREVQPPHAPVTPGRLTEEILKFER